MFPIGDDDNVRTVPVVTYVLIALNVLVFLMELNAGDAFIKQWAFVPSRFSSNPTGETPTIFTAMFMHGGWLHLFGNMLYLWIFGDNVEDELGRVKFLVFYLALRDRGDVRCNITSTTQSRVPNVGASGAIAGVLGAYMLMFPRAKVNVLVLAKSSPCQRSSSLGLWIVLQLFSGVGSIANTSADTGGVAYMAHVGGFVAGLVIAFLLGQRGGPSRSA